MDRRQTMTLAIKASKWADLRRNMAYLVGGINDFWKRYKKNRGAVVGLIVIASFVAVAVFTPYLSLYDPYKIDLTVRNVAPCSRHPLGTDDFGRDILSRLMWGSRVSLSVGFVSAGIAGAVAVFFGSISGYYGGKIDDIIMRLADIFMIIPTFFLVLLIVSVFGGNIYYIMVVVGLTQWPSPTRIMRAQFLSVREKDFIEASVALGASDFRIIVSHILPNAIYPIIIRTSLAVSYGIMTEAGLSFLGLGDPNLITWGGMLNRAMLFIRNAWWQALFPGLAISALVLAFNMVGDGLNDAFNPKLRER